MAFVPGAMIGAMPPLIGWWTAGGRWPDVEFGLLLLFVIIWQLPHFWNLLLAYRIDYKKAGLPTPYDVLSERKIEAISLILAVITTCVCILLFVSGDTTAWWIKALIIGLALGWIIWIRVAMTNRARQARPLQAFHLVNALGALGLLGAITQRLMER